MRGCALAAMSGIRITGRSMPRRPDGRMRVMTTPIVRVEALSPTGRTATVGELSIDEPCGSMSSTGPDGDRVFLFGWRDDGPGVWESIGGLSQETVAVREIVTVGLKLLSDLSEPYVLTIYVKGVPRLMRFTASR
jgi:hypothetical protein